MKNLFASLFGGLAALVRRIPFKAVLAPLWKGAARALLQKEADELAAQVKGLIDDDADASIVRVNAAIDAFQAKAIAGVHSLSFLPAALRAPLEGALQGQGDALQAALVAAIKGQGPLAVDQAFAALTAQLTAIIDRA